MSLDCVTPNGKRFIASQNEVCRRIESAMKVRVIATDNDSKAPVDAVIEKGDMIAAVAEIKSRQMTYEQLERFGTYLITAEKLDSLILAASLLYAEGFLFVHLIKDGKIVYWKICDDEGVPCFEYKTERTVTQATCNGGTATRLNAFLPVSRCRVL